MIELILISYIAIGNYKFDPLSTNPEIPEDLKINKSTVYILLLKSPIYDFYKLQIEKKGARILHYVPLNSFAVRVKDTLILNEIKKLDFVKGVYIYQPAFKISSNIGKKINIKGKRYENPYKNIYYVHFFEDVGKEEARKILEKYGAKIISEIKSLTHPVFVLEYKDSIKKLAFDENIFWIEEKRPFFKMNDRTYWVIQNNVLNTSPIWNKGIKGENQIINIMDTGVDTASCFFRNNKIIWKESYSGFYTDACKDGHGTHVAGTIAGYDVSNTLNQFKGMAYNAKLTVQFTGDNFFTCWVGALYIPDDLYNAFLNAYNVGARIFSNSWGGLDTTVYTTLDQQVDKFMYDNNHAVCVFAAGNSGGSVDQWTGAVLDSVHYRTIGTPGAAKNVVTVGATPPPPKHDISAFYSSKGPTFDGRIKPDVMAPGGDCGTSALNQDPNLYIRSADNDTLSYPTCDTASYPFMGTSMATPAVAGGIALIRQYFTEGWYPSGIKDPNNAFIPSGALLKAMIISSAEQMNGTDPYGIDSREVHPIPDSSQGWGRIKLENSLYFQGDIDRLYLDDNLSGLSTGSSKSYIVTSNGGKLKVVLVWTDYPANAGSGVALVNDLNLIVQGPSGTYYGNRFYNGESQVGGQKDNRNPVEVFYLSNAPQGNYVVQVEGGNVPHGPQKYAIVITGRFSSVFIEEKVSDKTISIKETYLRKPIYLHSSNSYLIRFGLKENTKVKLSIFDISGKKVTVIKEGIMEKGEYILYWNKEEVKSGTYFLYLETGKIKLREKFLKLN
ncbi:MAG: S8 family serine peptidase [Candidatus Hydrothermales bacterium]